MSSRKKNRPRPQQSTATPQQHPRKMSVPAILAIGLVVGAIVGIVVAVMIHFSTPTAINVGTFTLTTAPTTAPLSDNQLYISYAGSSACRECHTKEYELWAKSHHG